MSCFEGWKIGKEWENPWKIHTSKGWWRKSYDGRVMFPVSSQPRIPAKPWKQGRSWKCTDPVAIHLVRTSSLNTRIHGYWWNTTSQPPSETLPNTKREISQQWWCKVWLYAMTFCMCVCVNLHLLVSRCYLFAKELFRAWYVRLICKYISWASPRKDTCLFNDLCHYPVVCTTWCPQSYPVDVKKYLLGLQRWHVGILFDFLRITFYHMQS